MNLKGIANITFPSPAGANIQGLLHWGGTITTSLQSLQRYILQGINPRTPSGMMVLWGDSVSAPDGYYLCDGSAISRTRDEGIFFVIGTTFGIGDGSTTFNLPDNATLSPPSGLKWIIKQ